MLALSANSLTQLWSEACSYVIMQGGHHESRNGGSRYVIGATLNLRDIDNNFVVSKVRKASPVYASAELLWYLSGSNRVETIAHYAPSYKNFAEDDGHVHGAYGARDLHWQLQRIVPILHKYPESRQAVLTFWEGYDLMHATDLSKRDLPCTICLQFQIAENKLHCTAYMRSNDLWLGLPYDIYCFTSIQRMLAGWLGVRLGMYTHFVGNLHLYDKHIDRVNADDELETRLGHGYPACTFAGYSAAVTAFEQPAYPQNPFGQLESIESPLMRDSAALCLGRDNQITSPLLKEALRVNNS